jgi:tetratricopeptide (TPR) repeat protein
VKTLTDWFRHPGAQAALIVLAVALTYGHTLGVPFYLDDFSSITENLALHDIGDLGQVLGFSPPRAVGFLTLAVNYDLHGDQVAGYHLVNIAIHALAGLAVFALLQGLLRTPAARRSGVEGMQWVPLAVALLFVLHPLQTQAVTYVIQRLASLAALFYLASLACYAWGRLGRRPILLAGALVFGLLALFTKQNAATLPLAILLVELLFFRRFEGRQRWLLLAGTALLAAAVAGLLQIGPIDRLTRETPDIGRLDYLATQVQVLWQYLGTFLYPVGLRIEYDTPLQQGFGSPVTWLAAAGHLGMILSAFALWSRWPLVAFGILFFYLAHGVESSVIPISDLVFEHRMYLPMLGVATALVAALFRLVQGAVVPRAAAGAALAVCLLTLGGLTVARNALWQDTLALLERDTELSPNSERAWTSYAKELMRRGRMEEALPALAAALNLGRTEDGVEVTSETLVNAILALYYTGQPQKAAMMEGWLPMEQLSPIERSRLNEVKGLWLLRTGQTAEAREHLERASAAFPNPMAEAGLAVADYREGNQASARFRAEGVLAQDPSNPLAREVMAQFEGGAAASPGAP